MYYKLIEDFLEKSADFKDFEKGASFLLEGDDVQTENDFLKWNSCRLLQFVMTLDEPTLFTNIKVWNPQNDIYLSRFIFNKEKVKLHQYAGAVIAIACSVLLSVTI